MRVEGNTLPVLWTPSGGRPRRELVVSAPRRMPPLAHRDPFPLPIPGRGAARLRAAYGLDEQPGPVVDLLA